MLCRGLWFVNYCHRPDRISLLCMTTPAVRHSYPSLWLRKPGLREDVGLTQGDLAGKQWLPLGLEPVDPTAIRLGLFPSLTALSKLKPGPSLQPCQLPPSLTHWEGALFFFTTQSQFLTFRTPPSLSSLHLPLS